MFNNIPQELRELRQWVLWRKEFRPPMLKPTKVPYIAEPNGGKASVTQDNTWRSFDDVTRAPLTCVEAVDPDEPVSKTGYSGIGFVFKLGGGYTGVDCDYVHEDPAALDYQKSIFQRFNSYTERSPSGNGVHIIVKGEVPSGRRRGSVGVELYPHHRFFTMTGDVYYNAPIEERQEALTALYNEFGGDVKQYIIEADPEQKLEDEAVVKMGMDAVNGEKFTKLWEGQWQSLYSSQSEADFALVDMLAFYTKHIPQIVRLFRQSMLGQRDKAQRDDYVMYMVEKAFDRQLPPLDFDVNSPEKFAAWLALHAGSNVAAGANSTVPGKVEGEAATTATTAPGPAIGITGEGKASLPQGDLAVNSFPPGLLGEIAEFFYRAAPRPAFELALAGAIGYMAGICGRAYNVSGTGLNQYILMLAATGTGKDAIASGTAKLNAALQPINPTIQDYKGPGQLVSAPGTIKWLERKPCVFSILGEFGKKLKQMSAPNAPAHLTGLAGCLLEMYSKSGGHEVFDPMAYSDKDKNTSTLRSPSLTIFAESVPESFYEALDESMVADGLLPRFMVFEYKGERAYYNRNALSTPPLGLVSRLNDVLTYCNATTNRFAVHHVEMNEDVREKEQELDRWTTDIINQTSGEVARQLWNRVHLQSLKLSALLAIGEHHMNPVIRLDHFMWASNLIVEQTRRLIAKFESGQVGIAAATGEGKQVQEVVKVFNELFMDAEKYCKYGGRMDMFEKFILTESQIQRRLIASAPFRNDRMGASFAIKRALKILLEADDIREVPATQMLALFQSKPRAFQIQNPARFAPEPR